METKTTNTQELVAVEDLKEKLYTAVNESGLSIVPVYYVMKDMMNEVIMIYNAELKKIATQEQQSKEEDSVEIEE